MKSWSSLSNLLQVCTVASCCLCRWTCLFLQECWQMGLNSFIYVELRCSQSSKHFHWISIATGMISDTESFGNVNLYIGKTGPFPTMLWQGFTKLNRRGKWNHIYWQNPKTHDLESFWNHAYELDYLSCHRCKWFHLTAVFCGWNNPVVVK